MNNDNLQILINKYLNLKYQKVYLFEEQKDLNRLIVDDKSNCKIGEYDFENKIVFFYKQITEDLQITFNIQETTQTKKHLKNWLEKKFSLVIHKCL